MASGGILTALINLDFSGFTKGIEQVKRQTKQLEQTFQGSFQNSQKSIEKTRESLKGAARDMKDLERIVGGILLSQAFYGATNAIQNAASEVLNFSSNMEKAQIAFEYFLDSPQAAEGFINNMKDFSADTAFNTQQALDLSRRLMAAQFDPRQVRSVMETLNDASAAAGGTPEQMDRIVLALTQIKTNGKIAGQELRQLAEAGIPIYKILQEELQLTGEEVMNIGDLKIPGDLGVAAVLQGLEKRYKGAADKIADTLPGMLETISDNLLFISEKVFHIPYQALKKFVTGWRDALETFRGFMDDGGIGNAMEKMFPPALHNSFRLIAGSLKQIGQSMVDLHKAMLPVWQLIGGGLVQALGIVLPLLSGLFRGIVWLIQSAFEAVPALKYLVAAIAGLIIAQGVAKALFFLWSVMRLGVIASVVAHAVNLLRVAITGLLWVLTKHPILIVVGMIAAGFLYWASTSKTVVAWLDQIMARLASLGGFDLGGILQPEPTGMEAWEDYFNESFAGVDEVADAIGGIGDNLDDTGEKGKKNAKKIKDSFIAAFDEVYQIPEKSDTGSDDGGGSGDGGAETPDFKLPAMPEMPGLPDMDEFPDEIELPKFKIPPIDWPPIPAYLKEPQNIRFKVEWPQWPKFPGPPPALVTAWEFGVGTIRALLRGWLVDLQNLHGQIPKLLPGLVPNVVPQLQPVLEGLGNFGRAVGGLFDALKERLMGQWGAAWQGIGAVATAGAAVALGVIGNFLGQAAAGWSAGWNSLQTTASAVLTAVGETLRSWATNGLATIGTFIASSIPSLQVFGEFMKALFQETMKNVGDTLKNGWEWIKQGWEDHKWTILAIIGAIIAGIILWFVGLPAGVLAAIAALIARVGPAFARMGPAIFGAIKGIPGIFKNIMSMLPPEAQTQINNVVNWFKKLPERFKDFVKQIVIDFSIFMAKLPSEAGKVVGNIVGAFMSLPQRIYDAIKGIPAKVKEVMGNIQLPSFSTLASGGVKATFNTVRSIAGFENGGIIGKDSIVRVGERGRQEAIIPLQNGAAMAPFAQAVAQYLQGGSPQPQQQQADQRPILYVGTLIADDRSLRDLERRMQVVRQQEEKRGVK